VNVLNNIFDDQIDFQVFDLSICILSISDVKLSNIPPNTKPLLLALILNFKYICTGS
jgi:hypothetical protein